MSRAEKRRQQKLALKTTKSEQPAPAVAAPLNLNLDLAVQHHAAGRLDEAESACQQVLQAEPNHPVALHLLAMVTHKLGRNDQAIDLISRVLTIKPDYAEAHNSFAIILKNMGRLDEAVASYHRAIAINPNYGEAHYNLGNALLEQGNADLAVASYQTSLAINPGHLNAHYNLANALRILARLDEAVAKYRQVLAINPAYGEAHNNLGLTLQQQGKLAEAIACFSKVTALNPDNAEGHFILGNAFLEAGRIDEAEATFKRTITLNPDFAEAHLNLGNVYNEMQNIGKATDSFRDALAINPDLADAHYNLGNALLILQREDEAMACFEKALAINPDHCESFNNLGNALYGLGRPARACDNYRKAMAITAHYAVAHSNLIFTQDLLPDIDQIAQQAERKCWNDTFIVPLSDQIRPHDNDKNPQRRLRIGYVSADFRRHSACLGFAPLIVDHDRQNFDVTCYDATPTGDVVSATLRAAASQWRDIKNIDDTELAATIRADAIDILVDLSGHTRGNRLKIFGHKPAPLQVTGIGHLAPGLTTIDYRLTTQWITPPEEAAIYPEQPIYLDTYFGFTAPAGPPPLGPPPCLENGCMTFGFLGRFNKISDAALALWAGILQAVPDSTLLLKYSQLDAPEARQKIIETFAAFGISPERLTLLGNTDQGQHLEAHNCVDIILDSVPHGGGITALESLWMGVPVIGLASPEKAGSRIIRSICQPLDLEQCATGSLEDYHACALHWAAHADKLLPIRQRLRQRVSDTYAHFPGDVEKSYRLIWQRWCKGETAAPLWHAGRPHG